jgi:hypothetical protein
MFCLDFSSKKMVEKARKLTPVSSRAFRLLASAVISRRKAFASFSVLKNLDFCLPLLSTIDALHGDFRPFPGENANRLPYPAMKNTFHAQMPFRRPWTVAIPIFLWYN